LFIWFYENSYEQNVSSKVADKAMRYTQCNSGDHMILMVKQASMPENDHCLQCPMPGRMKDVEIHEIPKSLTLNPTTLTHSIVIADPAEGDIPTQFCYDLRPL